MAKGELTEQQKLFAEYYHETGNATQSAIKAGYSASSASSQGSRLLNNVKIKKYLEHLRQEEGVVYDMDLDLAIEVLVKLIQDPDLKPNQRIDAINTLAMLKGWKRQDTKIEINNNPTPESISDEELMKRMEEIINANKPDLKRVK